MKPKRTKTSPPSSAPGLASPAPDPPARRERLCVRLILGFSGLLRLVIALLNDAANDNHLQVVQLLLAGRRGLTMRDCLECFHPKLYYGLMTLPISGLDVATDFFRLRLGQFINAMAGLLTCWIVYRFLLRLRMSSTVRILVLALVALNPAFVAINGQFTNDSLAILLAVAGIYWMTQFGQGRRLRFFWLASICLALAFATKATTWVCGIVAVFSLLVSSAANPRADAPRPHRRLLLAAGLTLVLLSTIAIAGYDFKSYNQYADHSKSTKLHLFERTLRDRPGVVSIYESYLTFKLVDLLRHPYTSNGRAIHPAHRTSVFSQLHGRLHFLHLDSWPPAWQLRGGPAFHVGRLNIALGLVPTALFLLGLGVALRREGAALVRERPWRWLRSRQEPELVCLLLCLGTIGFMVVFTAMHRDFCAIKPVYMFPGMLGFAALLASGCQHAFDRLGQAKLPRRILQAALLLLLAGYVADVVVLAGQLYQRNGAAIMSNLRLG